MGRNNFNREFQQEVFYNSIRNWSRFAVQFIIISVLNWAREVLRILQ